MSGTRQAPWGGFRATALHPRPEEARFYGNLDKGYVKAAEVEIPRLQADIAKAKAMGLKPEQIAEGEEKLRRIQQMRDQLASEHPEVLKQ